MATRRLELTSNDGHAAFELTDTSFIVKGVAGVGGFLTVVGRRLRTRNIFLDKQRLEIPLRRVLWAAVEGGAVDVHVLAKKNGRLVLAKVEGTFEGDAGKEWAQALMDAAYAGVKPRRHFLVLVNPHGGPGKANLIYRRKVEPVLRIAHCTSDVIFTEYQFHAIKIAAELPLGKYDAVISVSGDGTVHEIFNGFSQHSEPMKAFKIPVVPVPAGSGNGSSLNLLGLEEGLDVVAAALNAIKGRPMPVDLCSILQNGKRSFSFMSQCVGLMADLDLGTEHLRWMGSNRFIYGFMRGIVTKRTYPVSISIKAVETDKEKMLQSARSAQERSTELLFESAVDTPGATDGAVLPPLKYASDDTEGWIHLEEPVLYLFAGKGPYVSQDLMQFPVSLPNDGAFDVVIQYAETRMVMLRSLEGSEHGGGYWRKSCRYIKASAYHVKPLDPHGYLSVDGEKFPFGDFFVEVHQGLGTMLSPYGRYAAAFDTGLPEKK